MTRRPRELGFCTPWASFVKNVNTTFKTPLSRFISSISAIQTVGEGTESKSSQVRDKFAAGAPGHNELGTGTDGLRGLRAGGLAAERKAQLGASAKTDNKSPQVLNAAPRDPLVRRKW